MKSLLFNSTIPGAEIENEKVEHRAMILLKAQGLSNKEVADATGYSQGQVSTIVRQPWFQEKVLAILHSHGEEEVEKLMNQMAPKLLLMAQELAEKAQSESVRSNTILGLLKVVKGEKQVQVRAPESLEEIRSRKGQIERQLAEISGEDNGDGHLERN